MFYFALLTCRLHRQKSQHLRHRDLYTCQPYIPSPADPEHSCGTVVKAPKSCHITPILRSLHWLMITERIEYKLLSFTYKVLTTTQPPYLYNLISTERPRNTRSSPVVTLARPPTSFSLKITHRSFRCASPCL